MWHRSNPHQGPLWIIESTTSALPMRRPSRTRGSRYGQPLIDSMPPATAMSMSPARMPWSAIITALSPEPHTLLIVSAATWWGRPPWSAAWRAGFCPRPADTTLPMMHSSTIAGSMPARRTASATTSAPSCVAVKPFSAPRNFPVGVRTADTMTDSRTANLDPLDGIRAEKRAQAFQDHRRRAHDLARPLRRLRVDRVDAVLEFPRRHALERGADGRAPRAGYLAVGERRGAEDFNEC